MQSRWKARTIKINLVNLESFFPILLPNLPDTKHPKMMMAHSCVTWDGFEFLHFRSSTNCVIMKKILTFSRGSFSWEIVQKLERSFGRVYLAVSRGGRNLISIKFGEKLINVTRTSLKVEKVMLNKLEGSKKAQEKVRLREKTEKAIRSSNLRKNIRLSFNKHKILTRYLKNM